jgi:hypothetical protein
MRNTRQSTNKLLDLMDEGAIDPMMLASMCLAYMSEADVKDMCEANDLFQDEE